jgi:high-affinity Fe2+/Pb2+ permease
VVGQVLRGLFGYNADPSLTEALSYLVYLITVGFALARRRALIPAQQHA